MPKIRLYFGNNAEPVLCPIYAMIGLVNQPETALVSRSGI